MEVPLYRRVGSSRYGVDEPTGAVAQVDAEDYDRVVAVGLWRHHSAGYATCKIRRAGRRVTVLMHRLILNVDDSTVHVDHRDHDPLNNCRSNLRSGTQADNNRNTPNRPRSDSSSQYKGVGRWRGRWRAQGWEDGRTVWLGAHPTELTAKAAYDRWEASR
jgi:hypothetical protein